MAASNRYRIEWYRDKTQNSIADHEDVLADTADNARRFWELQHPDEVRRMSYIRTTRLTPLRVSEMKAMQNWQLERIADNPVELAFLLQSMIGKLKDEK